MSTDRKKPWGDAQMRSLLTNLQISSSGALSAVMELDFASRGKNKPDMLAAAGVLAALSVCSGTTLSADDLKKIEKLTKEILKTYARIDRKFQSPSVARLA